MSTEENFQENVNRLSQTINATAMFNVREIVGALDDIKRSRNHKPCITLSSSRLFDVVFDKVIKNYHIDEDMMKRELKYINHRIWRESTAPQKSIYQTYCKQHNDEMNEIFPENIPSYSQNLRTLKPITPGVNTSQITETPSSQQQSILINGDYLSSPEDFPIFTDVQGIDEMVIEGTGLT